jgi:hypothetical protein
MIEWSKAHCWTFGHSVYALFGIDASPHTNYLPNC